MCTPGSTQPLQGPWPMDRYPCSLDYINYHVNVDYINYHVNGVEQLQQHQSSPPPAPLWQRSQT
ncbi:BQ5605_C045g12213 [Microbotryum silenes-dioicae]|uniref:BQ5605_C045g12213 protein n=1 Tax=Microbotryum silenes-dioicae TaxID=796604 RepID=A0A2X0MTA9_9BASI|nr:BQ5605_C045g12213 [Microbotryum silenes-dioicae]